MSQKRALLLKKDLLAPGHTQCVLLTRLIASSERFLLSLSLSFFCCCCFQYVEIQEELSGFREKYENAEEEKCSFNLELQQSQERLRLLQDKENHVSVQSM